MTSIEYMAGYFDGEGCIRVTQNKRDNGFGIHVFITNTYYPFLEELSRRFGGKVSRRNVATDRRKEQYQWRISNKYYALKFLVAINQFLIEKKPQADLAIEFCKLPDIRANRFSNGDPVVRARKAEIAEQISQLKKVQHLQPQP